MFVEISPPQGGACSRRRGRIRWKERKGGETRPLHERVSERLGLRRVRPLFSGNFFSTTVIEGM
jgi:hypothetical protein